MKNIFYVTILISSLYISINAYAKPLDKCENILSILLNPKKNKAINIFDKLTESFIEEKPQEINIDKLISLIYKIKRNLSKDGLDVPVELHEIEKEVNKLELKGSRVYVAGAGQTEKIDLVKRIIGGRIIGNADLVPYSFRFFENTGDSTTGNYLKQSLYDFFPVKKGDIINKRSDSDGLLEMLEVIGLDLDHYPDRLVHEKFKTNFKDIHFIVSPSMKFFKHNDPNYAKYIELSDYLFINLTHDDIQINMELGYLKALKDKIKGKKVAFFVTDYRPDPDVNSAQIINYAVNELKDFVKEENIIGAWSIDEGDIFVPEIIKFNGQHSIDSKEFEDTIFEISSKIAKTEKERVLELINRLEKLVEDITIQAITNENTVKLITKLISLNINENINDSSKFILDNTLVKNLSSEWARQLTQGIYKMPESVKIQVERMTNSSIGKIVSGSASMITATAKGFLSLNDLIFKRKQPIYTPKPTDRLELKLQVENEVRWQQFAKMLTKINYKQVDDEIGKTIKNINRDLSRSNISLDVHGIRNLVLQELDKNYKKWIKEALEEEGDKIGEEIIPEISNLNKELLELVTDESAGIFKTKKIQNEFEKKLEREIKYSLIGRTLYSKTTNTCRDVMMPVAMAAFVGTIYMLATSDDSINWIRIISDQFQTIKTKQSLSVTEEEMSKFVPYINGFISTSLAVSTYLTINALQDYFTPHKVACSVTKVYKRSLKDILDKNIGNKMFSVLDTKKPHNSINLKAGFESLKDVGKSDSVEGYQFNKSLPSYEQILRMENIVNNRLGIFKEQIDEKDQLQVIEDVLSEFKGI